MKESIMIKKFHLLVPVFAGVALALAPQNAMATNWGGIQAEAGAVDSPSCWQRNNYSMINTCETPQTICLPATTTSSGGLAGASANVTSPNAAGLVQCLAQTWDASNQHFYNSGYQNVQTFGSPQSINFSISQPTAWNLVICCQVNKGGQVNSFGWSTP
jgi:hypothetical protein